jgi:predicted hotdog family 3-hydroxylacyl-ACP dehydratase
MTAAERALGPVSDYLPHRPPMLLIDRIVEVSAHGAVCAATWQPDCVLAVAGRIPASAAIELVAQTCAIFLGVRGERGGAPPQVGMIAACREVTFAVDSFAIGDALTIAIHHEFGQPPVASFTARVSRGDAVVATMALSVVAGAPEGAA